MPFPKKEKVKIVCQYKPCSKEIYVLPWRADQVYCSMECYNKAKSEKLKLIHSLDDRRVLLYCQNEMCKKPFVVKKWEAKFRKYCCHECFREAKSVKHEENIIIYAKNKDNEDKRKIWKLNQN